MARSVAEGRFVVPAHWPRWHKRCGANKRGNVICNHWAVVGMSTCKYHGSGGEKNRKIGQLRYLAWIITGGPQDMPVEQAVHISLALWAERILKDKDAEKQMKAAMWITELLR